MNRFTLTAQTAIDSAAEKRAIEVGAYMLETAQVSSYGDKGGEKASTVLSIRQNTIDVLKALGDPDIKATKTMFGQVLNYLPMKLQDSHLPKNPKLQKDTEFTRDQCVEDLFTNAFLPIINQTHAWSDDVYSTQGSFLARVFRLEVFYYFEPFRRGKYKNPVTIPGYGWCLRLGAMCGSAITGQILKTTEEKHFSVAFTALSEKLNNAKM